jgi:hypothetical protein
MVLDVVFRIYVNGHEFWEGLGKRDTDRNRKRAEANAVRIGADIEEVRWWRIGGGFR